ncbi:MAG: hypothetical protein C4582_11185 [Desulfobacteraceae bacterium]|nr:MAG: hypothetical protein C4582_11185 [Desulfobacteraceae bacterium]
MEIRTLTSGLASVGDGAVGLGTGTGLTTGGAGSVTGSGLTGGGNGSGGFGGGALARTSLAFSINASAWN